ncbi:LPS-assembly protein LptD [Candidatus Poribacteria bacterium]|nr:LPS-assembly protein LptD [Candidatus Poribacteria bacterium]
MPKSTGRWSCAWLALAAMCMIAAAWPGTARAQGGELPFAESLDFGEAGELARIESTERLFTVEDVAYGVGRTTIAFRDLTISADRMIIDLVSQDVQAEGDVLFLGPKEEVRASSARYNFRRHEGVAFDAEGRYKTLFFRAAWDEEKNGPSFRRISEDETLFRGATYTTCNFPVPHYFIAASEILILIDNRVFLRDAVLHVRGVPVFYWPFYTRAFDGASPWSWEFGYKSNYGGYARVGYELTHESKVPDWNDPKKYRTRTSGVMGLNADAFTGGAAGAGLTYRYRADFEKHIGEMNLYGIRDNVRDVESEDAPDRWIYRHKHNSMFGKTIMQFNADWVSDPDIYYDLLDSFSDEDFGRRSERRVRAAMTYLEEDWIARISAEMKDRVTLPTYVDATEPNADDLLYDPDPDFTKDNGNDSNGIDRDRYGRVSEKLEGRVASRLLPLAGAPLYWRVEANAFDNLDAGFNELSQQDDERIYGSDTYGSLSHRTKLDGQGRFTWLNTVGAGVGYYSRTSDDLVPSGKLGPGSPAATVGSVSFKDQDSVFLGGSGRSVSYGDVDPLYVWADYTSRLNARFTDTLSGFLKYTYRQGTGDSAGGFFEETGRTEAFEDIYDFPVASHWVEGFLEYALLYPNTTTYLAAGHNLQSDSDIFANEKIRYAGTGARYANNTGEFTLDSFVGIEDRQVRDRKDPSEFERSELNGNVTARYMPRHGRYWGEMKVSGTKALDDDPVAQAARKRARFDEDATDISIEPLIGKQFGPKYAVELTAEYNTRYDDIKSAGVIIKRDLHDAELMLFGGMKRNSFRGRDNNDSGSNNDPEGQTELDFRVSLKVKQPREKAKLGAVSIKTLKDREKDSRIIE